MDGEHDEITFTTDSAVNFAQLAVRTCQRAQGEKNKALREAWVRLCGTYQSRGGDVANKEVRKVSDFGLPSGVSSHPSAPRGGCNPAGLLSRSLAVRVNCDLSGSRILLRMDLHDGSHPTYSARVVSSTI